MAVAAGIHREKEGTAHANPEIGVVVALKSLSLDGFMEFFTQREELVEMALVLMSQQSAADGC